MRSLLSGRAARLVTISFLLAATAAPVRARPPAARPAAPGQGIPARAHPLPRAVLGHWYGSGCPDNGSCGCARGSRSLAEEMICQLDALEQHDIPISVYLFDGGAWSHADSFRTNTCTGPDCCRWKLGEAAIARLRRAGARAMLHFWGGCHEEEHYRRAADALGETLLGFYLDDGSSDAEAARALAFVRRLPAGDGEVTLKAIQGRTTPTTEGFLRTQGNLAYSGDTLHDLGGLRDGIRRLFANASNLPAVFSEFTGYAYPHDTAPKEEHYLRRLHYGAFQAVMANTPYGNADPWHPRYSPALLERYRFYAWLHEELVPYVHSLARNMHERPGEPVLRRTSVTDASMMLGDALFVAFVTEEKQTERTVVLPPGQWVDFWDDTRVVSGTVTVPAPPGREPIFVRAGSLLPLQVSRPYTGHGDRTSQGHLTLRVEPGADASFRYWEQLDTRGPGRWIDLALRARRAPGGETLTVTASTAPAQPVLVRVMRTPSAPAWVASLGGGTARRLVVATAGTRAARPPAAALLPRLPDEAALTAGQQTRGWVHDPERRILVVRTTL